MDKFTSTASIAATFAGVAIALMGIGPGLCFTAVGAGEFNDFAQPSDIDCGRTGVDLGLPPGCGDGPSPHNRILMAVALSTGTGTLTAEGRYLNSLHVFDAETFRPVDYADAARRAAIYDLEPPIGSAQTFPPWPFDNSRSELPPKLLI
jgi:hypothetical protein